jgi:hypothetical protein
MIDRQMQQTEPVGLYQVNDSKCTNKANNSDALKECLAFTKEWHYERLQSDGTKKVMVEVKEKEESQ